MVSKSSAPLADILQSRIDCLRAITDDPQEKRDLTDTLDIPRSTLDDIVRELEENDLVEYKNGKWYPTPSGQLACEIHCSHLDSIQDLISSKPVLEALDHTHSLHKSIICGSEVKEPHPSVSGDLMDTFLEHVRKSDTARIATPQVLAGYDEEFQQCLSSNSENTVEVVLAPELRDWCSSQNSEGTKELRDNPALSLLWGEIPLEFGLTIFDDNKVIVTAFADRGIAGLIINETRSAVRRATATYESVKQNAVVGDGSKQMT